MQTICCCWEHNLLLSTKGPEEAWQFDTKGIQSLFWGPRETLWRPQCKLWSHYQRQGNKPPFLQCICQWKLQHFCSTTKKYSKMIVENFITFFWICHGIDAPLLEQQKSEALERNGCNEAKKENAAAWWKTSLSHDEICSKQAQSKNHCHYCINKRYDILWNSYKHHN